MQETPYIAYHNDALIHIQAIQLIQDSIATGRLKPGANSEDPGDCIIKVMLGEFHRGTIGAQFHETYGFPPEVAHMAEAVFERLPLEDARAFALAFNRVTPTGAVLDKFVIHYMMSLTRLLKRRAAGNQEKATLNEILELYDDYLLGASAGKLIQTILKNEIARMCDINVRINDVSATWLHSYIKPEGNLLEPSDMRPHFLIIDLIDTGIVPALALADLILDNLENAPRPEKAEVLTFT